MKYHVGQNAEATADVLWALSEKEGVGTSVGTFDSEQNCKEGEKSQDLSWSKIL